MAEIEVPDDYAEPEITVWPECQQCHTAYVYRRSYVAPPDGTPWPWYWRPHCESAKCRRESTPVLVKEESDG